VLDFRVRDELLLNARLHCEKCAQPDLGSQLQVLYKSQSQCLPVKWNPGTSFCSAFWSQIDLETPGSMPVGGNQVPPGRQPVARAQPRDSVLECKAPGCSARPAETRNYGYCTACRTPGAGTGNWLCPSGKCKCTNCVATQLAANRRGAGTTAAERELAAFANAPTSNVNVHLVGGSVEDARHMHDVARNAATTNAYVLGDEALPVTAFSIWITMANGDISRCTFSKLLSNG
jgi:hypothetical protein